jgi:hypothetical protein
MLDFKPLMATQQQSQGSSKISAEFASRLARLAPDQQIRAIVLAAQPAPAQANFAQNREQARAHQAATTQTLLRDLFHDVDRQLAQTGGRRLTHQPNALGHIVVETTAHGIHALCDLENVNAILEDQSIHPHFSKS